MTVTILCTCCISIKAIVNGLEVEEEAERELKQQQIAQQQTENLGKKLGNNIEL